MRRSKLAIATLALAAALLAAAPATGADPESETSRGTNGFGAFALQGSNGYRIQVWAIFRPGYGESSRVLIRVGRRGQGVFYVAPAVVTHTRIDADLGRLGRIALRFEPTGAKGVARPSCAPDQGVPYDKGSYVGEFEFRGEEGYTVARADRLAHSPRLLLQSICGIYSVGELFGHRIPGARLTAHSRRGKDGVSLQVNQNRAGAPVRVEASIRERRGRVGIFRQVGLWYPGRAFGFAPDLRFAALRPPAPFSGTGTFRRGAEAPNRWTGNLAVDFPGHSNVSLTGNRFRTELRHARRTESRSREGGRNRPNLPVRVTG